MFEIVESAFRALPPPLADVTNMEGESRGVPSAPAGSDQLESGQLALPGGAACKQKKVFSLSSDARGAENDALIDLPNAIAGAAHSAGI